MKIDDIILGYVVYTVEKNDIRLVAELFLKHNISMKFDGNKFAVSVRKTKLIEAVLGTRVKFSKSKIMGIGGFLYYRRKRVGIILSMIVCAIFMMLSYDRVWDVRIEGGELTDEVKILEELERCGFSVGTRWSEADLSNIELKMLSESKCVSWLNINRRGTVAYVSVVDKVEHGVTDEDVGYANIVAAYDAIIEEITVVRGVAKVKPGDIVKAGDLLISGVLPSESGGGFCRAEGTVMARVEEELVVEIPNSEVVYVKGKESLKAASVEILGFSVNIFKYSRNSGEKCDIIEKTKSFSFLGKKIPLSVNSEYEVFSKSEVRHYTASEMTDMASFKMQELLNQRLADSTLVKIKTEAEFSDSSYVMKSSILRLSDISITLPFVASVP